MVVQYLQTLRLLGRESIDWACGNCIDARLEGLGPQEIPYTCFQRGLGHPITL